MMEAVETALIEHDVSTRDIDSERFDIGAAASIGPRQQDIRRLVVVLAAIMIGAAAWFAA